MMMKLRLLALLVAGGCWIAPGALAAPPDKAVASGLSVSLTLPTYTYWVNMMPPVDTNRWTGSLPATFTLINRSGENLRFTLLSPAWSNVPLQKVQFVLRSAAGRILWRRYVYSARNPPERTLATLGNGRVWQSTQAIPMVVGGRVLPRGRYTVEALINGSPTFRASAPFRVDYAY